MTGLVLTGGGQGVESGRHLGPVMTGSVFGGLIAVGVSLLSPALVLAVVAVVVVAAVAVVSLQRVRTGGSIESRGDVATSAPHVDVLAELPVRSNGATTPDPDRTVNEAYISELDRVAGELVQLAQSSDGAVRVLVTSPGRGEGRSTLVQHLARRVADCGVDTIVVDGDLSRPSLHRRYAVPARPRGLNEILTTGDRVDPHLLAIRRNGRLNFLPAGRPTRGAEGLVELRFADALDSIRTDHGILIVDAAPVFERDGAAAAMAGAVDTTIVVARAGMTTTTAMVRTVERLGQIGARVLGVVLVGVATRSVLSRADRDAAPVAKTEPSTPPAAAASTDPAEPEPVEPTRPAAAADTNTAAATTEREPVEPARPAAAADTNTAAATTEPERARPSTVAILNRRLEWPEPQAPVEAPAASELPEPEESPLPIAGLVLSPQLLGRPGDLGRKVVIGPSPVQRNSADASPPDPASDMDIYVPWLLGTDAEPSRGRTPSPDLLAEIEQALGKTRPAPAHRAHRGDEALLHRIVDSARTPVTGRPRPRSRVTANR